MYLARDKENNSLFIFSEKPKLYKNSYFDVKYCISIDKPYSWWAKMDSNMFPEVTFENSPVEVELKHINHE